MDALVPPAQVFPSAALYVSGCGSQRALHQNEIEPTAKLARDFAQRAGLGKAKLAVHADRGDVRCVDSPDHDVLVAARGFHNEMADERGSGAPPVRRFVNKNGMFDGERITGP